MQVKMIELFAVLTARLGTARRGEHGQGTLEYVGIAVVAAILVGAVVDAINGGQITTVIQEQIKKIVDKGATS